MFNKLKILLIKRPDILVYLYFGLITISMALLIRKGAPPDEVFHFDSIKYYASHGIYPIVGHQDSAFQLGDIARESSYLYHYLLSFPFRLVKAFNIEPFLILRIINILMAIGTLYVLNAIAINLKIIKSLRISLLFLVSNIPMFIFVSSAINYDNSVILLSALGFLICIKLTQKYSVKLVSTLLIMSVYGPLLKYSFLPLTLGFVIFCGIITLKNYKGALAGLKVFKRKSPILFVTVIFIFVIGSILFIERYVGNIYMYRNIRPNCNQVLTHEQCLNNGIYSRSQKIKQHKPREPVNISPDLYLVQWTRIMFGGTYGLTAHNKYNPTPIIINISLIMFYILIIYFFRYVWTIQKTRIYLFIPFISLFYILSLLLTNISAYRRSGIISLAVQGRYWLPVLLPFIFYVVYLGKLNNPKKIFARRILIVILICFSIFSGLPNILNGINSSWLSGGANAAIEKFTKK